MRVTHQNSYHKNLHKHWLLLSKQFSCPAFHNSGLDWWFRNWSQPFPYASDCCLATLEPWSTKIGVVTTMSPWIQVLGWTPRWLPWSCCSPLPSNPCSLTCLSDPKLDCSGLVHCFFSMWHITLMCRVVGTAVAEVKQRAGFDSQEVFGDQPPKAFTWAPCLRFLREACSTFRSFLVSFKHWDPMMISSIPTMADFGARRALRVNLTDCVPWHRPSSIHQGWTHNWPISIICIIMNPNISQLYSITFQTNLFGMGELRV